MNTGTLLRREVQGVGDAGEATPLLTSNNDVQDSEKERSLKRHVLEYVGMIHCLVVAGIVAWVINKKVQGFDDEPRPKEIMEWKSQVMGYASAILYCKHVFSHFGLDIYRIDGIRPVGSRVPQISE